MSLKKIAITFSVILIIILSAICIFLATNIKQMNNEISILSKNVETYKNINSVLQTENKALKQQEGKSNKSTDDIFESNPIDNYFTEIANIIEPTTTLEMVNFELICNDAWEAEMINCYEILKNATNYEDVKNLIDNEKEFYDEYIKKNADLRMLLGASDAFDNMYNDGSGYYIGSIGSIDRLTIITSAYEEKTAELFGYLKQIGITPEFIFSKEKYDEQMKQTFTDKWQKAFDNITGENKGT